MLKKIVPFLVLCMIVTACSTFAPAPTVTPTQTATLVPTETLAPTSTPTPIPPTETPSVVEELLPVGKPIDEWNGIPIMPGAINGESGEDSYRFTIDVSVEEVQAYYENELSKLGWDLLTSGTGDTGAVMMIFNNGKPPLMPISIIPSEDITLVLIVSSQ